MPNPTDAEPVAVTAPAAEPDAPDTVVSNTLATPPQEETREYVATGPIFINGVRAYNEGSRISARAVKRNKLEKFVKKA